MPTDQSQNAQTAAQHFEHMNEHLKNEFIIFGEAGAAGIHLLEPEKASSLGAKKIEDLGSVDAADIAHYTKTVISPKTPTSKSEIAIVNKDGVYDTMVWTTTPKNIRAALRAGVFEVKPIQNPLAKMIAQLGEYKQLVFSRSVEDSLVVKHNQKKLAIVDFTQDCIEALQPLHFSMNNYDGSVSPQENMQQLIVKVNALQTRLNEIKNTFYGAASSDPFYVKMCEDVKPLLAQLELYKNNLDQRLQSGIAISQVEMEGILRPYGNPLSSPDLSLQHFMQAQLNTMTNSAVVTNYNVSGLFQDTSGLQGIITETQFIAENFSSDNIDYHNPYTQKHAFEFGDNANAEGLVTLDMSRFGFVPSSRLELAKQVGVMQCIDDNRPLFKKTDQERGFFGINWTGNPLAPLTWAMNGLKDIAGTSADLVYVGGKAVADLVTRALGGKPSAYSFPSSNSALLKKDLAEEKYAAVVAETKLYDATKPATSIPHRSLLQQIYVGAGAIISRYLVDPVLAVSNVVGDEVLRQKSARRIWYDATIGTQKVDETAVGLLLEQRVSERRANEVANEISQESLVESSEEYAKIASRSGFKTYTDIATSIATRKAQDKLPSAATIPYLLTPDNPGDVFSWATDDFTRGLTEIFSKEIYRGHPIAGLAFTIAASTAAPMAFPFLAHNVILGAINNNFSLPLAKLLVGDTAGMVPMVSTALLQGKIAYLAVDIFNGRNGLMKKGIKALLENPVIATVVATSAVGFGFALAHEMNIPWLSQTIAQETSKASFPYFELGLTGAKIAAILVEGSLNLHKEHGHGMGDAFVDTAIERMRPEITSAMTEGYLKQHNLTLAQLTTEQKAEVEKQVNEYSEGIKSALKKPDIAAQVNQLSHTIGTMLNVTNLVMLNGEPAPVTTLEHQNELAMFLRQREKRHMIAELDPKQLTEKDKYIILNYLEKTYKNDPDYVTSVRSRFSDDVKVGPFGETFKIIMSYPGALIRTGIAAVRSGVYALGSVTTGDATKAAARGQIAADAFLPVQEFGRKVKNDLGLLVKGTASLFRSMWGMAAGALMMPMTVVLAAPARLLSPTLPTSIFARINRTLFAPGRVSQLIDASVGVMRADAGSKNLTLVTQDIDIRLNRQILNPAQHKKSVAPASAGVAPLVGAKTQEELEKDVLGLMKNAFNQHAKLRSLVANPRITLPQLMQEVTRAIVKGDQFTKLYLGIGRKPEFNTDLRKALLQVNDKIKDIPGVTFEEQLAQQKSVMELLQVNKRDPIKEIKQAYAGFGEFKLPAPPKSPILKALHTQIATAQVSLQELKVTYDSSQSRSQAVVQLLSNKDNEVLTLQSVRKLADLKKMINKMDKKDVDLPIAKQMLLALEIAHKGARSAAHRLAVDEPIISAIAQLHPHAAAAPHAGASAGKSPLPPPIPTHFNPARFHFDGNGAGAGAAGELSVTTTFVVTPLPSPLIPMAPPSGLMDLPLVKTLLADYVKNAIDNAHHDKSSCMLLKELQVCYAKRDTGTQIDAIHVTDKWQTFLGADIKAPSGFGSHSMIPAGVEYDLAANRDLNTSVIAPSLNNNESRRYYVLLDTNNAPVAKEQAGQFIASNRNNSTTITATQVPSIENATQSVTAGGVAATIPSNDYLLYADKQIQAFVNANGSDAKITIKGSDPHLVASYIILCEAKGLQYTNFSTHDLNFDMKVAVDFARSKTGVGAGMFIAPLPIAQAAQIEPAVFQTLKNSLSAVQLHDPVFKMVEKIQQRAPVDKSDLAALRTAVTDAHRALAVDEKAEAKAAHSAGRSI